MTDLGGAAPNGYICTIVEDGKECTAPAAWHIWVRGTSPRRCVRACPSHQKDAYPVQGEHPIGLACAVSGALWRGDHCVLPDEEYRELTKSTESRVESRKTGGWS